MEQSLIRDDLYWTMQSSSFPQALDMLGMKFPIDHETGSQDGGSVIHPV